MTPHTLLSCPLDLKLVDAMHFSVKTNRYGFEKARWITFPGIISTSPVSTAAHLHASMNPIEASIRDYCTQLGITKHLKFKHISNYDSRGHQVTLQCSICRGPVNGGNGRLKVGNSSLYRSGRSGKLGLERHSECSCLVAVTRRWTRA